MIDENIILRNMIINRGTAEVDNHISRDDFFDHHPVRECNIYSIIANKTLRFPTMWYLREKQRLRPACTHAQPDQSLC